MRPAPPSRPTASTVAATDPLYILYTSGTTGQPKGIVPRQRRPRRRAALVDAEHLRRSTPGDVWWTACDVGWVVGHSYIVYAPLLTGRDDRPLRGQAGRHAGRRRVLAGHRRARRRGLFTAPTAIRAIKKEDPTARCWPATTCPRFRTLFLAGERLDPDTYAVGRPSGSASRSSTTGGRPRPAGRSPPTCAGLEPMPIKPGSPTVPVPGYDVQVLDERGEPVAPGQRGRHLPPAADAARARCRRCGATTSATSPSYLSAFEGYYLTGDGGYVDEDGYLFVMGRTDDVLNVAGHRLSTGSMEAVLAGHPAVAECAVIGVADELKGQVPRGLVVLKSGRRRRAPTATGSARAGRSGSATRSGAVAALHQVDIVAALPKTRSGKILRKTMREIADGDDARGARHDRGRRGARHPHPGPARPLNTGKPACSAAENRADLVVAHVPARQTWWFCTREGPQTWWFRAGRAIQNHQVWVCRPEHHP